MKPIEQLCRQFCLEQFELTRHAFRRSVERTISELEIREAGEGGRAIELYPGDKYSPDCLLLMHP